MPPNSDFFPYLLSHLQNLKMEFAVLWCRLTHHQQCREKLAHHFVGLLKKKKMAPLSSLSSKIS